MVTSFCHMWKIETRLQGFSPHQCGGDLSIFLQVDCRVELPAGSEEEIEIRACTIWAVEQVMTALRERHGREGSPVPHSVQLDWYLWEQGERQRMNAPPHHQTITHFY